MTLLYVGDMVSVRQDGVERVGRVESFSSHRACTHVGVNLGQGAEWIAVRDVFAVVESVGQRKGPPGPEKHWSAKA